MVSQKFVDRIGAKLVRDDNLFDATLVSLGSVGVIHGVLLETEAIYTLEVHQIKLNYNIAFNPITTWDFTGVDLAKTKRPYHFEVTFNPNQTMRRAFIKVACKHEGLRDFRGPGHCEKDPSPGVDAFSSMGWLIDVAGLLAQDLTKAVLNKQVEKRYRPCGPA